MINPKPEDIGRGVVYQASYPDAPREDGAITRILDKDTVFVRYRDQHPGSMGQSTLCVDLEWAR